MFIPDIYTNLHIEALNKCNSAWQRPGAISDRPEVIRDLLEYGHIECTRTPKGRGSVCLYRIALENG